MVQYNSIVAVFKQSLERRFGSAQMIIPYLANEQTLNELQLELESLIYRIIGFRTNGSYDLARVSYLFDDLCCNLNDKSNMPLTRQIEEYHRRYLEILETHPNVALLIKAMKRIYSSTYDGKPGNYSTHDVNEEEKQFISINNASLAFGILPRNNVNNLPIIRENNIDDLEEILQLYIETVYNSNSFYNRFIDQGFASVYDPDTLKMMLFEGTILNITPKECYNLCSFFLKYIDFVNHKGIDSLVATKDHIVDTGLDVGLKQTDEKESYELYSFLKRSDVEYETPYYLTFFTRHPKNSDDPTDKEVLLELPNIRFGVSEDENGPVAYIYATQTAQSQFSAPGFDLHKSIDQSNIIKENIPKTSQYRNFNPNHLISLVLSFGIFKGMGIDNIQVIDKMPIRYYKTIKDKGYNTEEANKYLKRIQNKNTYLKLVKIGKGILITRYAWASSEEGPNTISIHISDHVNFDSDYLNNLYQKAYEYGRNVRQSEDNYSRY